MDRRHTVLPPGNHVGRAVPGPRGVTKPRRSRPRSLTPRLPPRIETRNGAIIGVMKERLERRSADQLGVEACELELCGRLIFERHGERGEMVERTHHCLDEEEAARRFERLVGERLAEGYGRAGLDEAERNAPISVSSLRLLVAVAGPVSDLDRTLAERLGGPLVEDSYYLGDLRDALDRLRAALARPRRGTAAAVPGTVGALEQAVSQQRGRIEAFTMAFVGAEYGPRRSVPRGISVMTLARLWALESLDDKCLVRWLGQGRQIKRNTALARRLREAFARAGLTPPAH